MAVKRGCKSLSRFTSIKKLTSGGEEMEGELGGGEGGKTMVGM